jgi:hypothetical protein
MVDPDSIELLVKGHICIFGLWSLAVLWSCGGARRWCWLGYRLCGAHLFLLLLCMMLKVVTSPKTRQKHDNTSQSRSGSCYHQGVAAEDKAVPALSDAGTLARGSPWWRREAGEGTAATASGRITIPIPSIPCGEYAGVCGRVPESFMLRLVPFWAQ